MDAIIDAAKRSNFKLDDSKAIIALINYGQRLNVKGHASLSSEVGKLILKNCTGEDQLHFRSAAIHLLREIEGTSFTKNVA